MNKNQEYIDCAKHWHGEQKRKYTGEPYFNHLENVAKIVERWGYPELMPVAYLHDIVEDTYFTAEEVSERFNAYIARDVWYLTDVPLFTGNRAHRNKLNNLRLSQAPESALIVKYADMIDNMKDIAEHDKKFATVYLEEIRVRFDMTKKMVPDICIKEFTDTFWKSIEGLRK